MEYTYKCDANVSIDGVADMEGSYVFSTVVL